MVSKIPPGLKSSVDLASSEPGVLAREWEPRLSSESCAGLSSTSLQGADERGLPNGVGSGGRALVSESPSDTYMLSCKAASYTGSEEMLDIMSRRSGRALRVREKKNSPGAVNSLPRRRCPSSCPCIASSSPGIIDSWRVRFAGIVFGFTPRDCMFCCFIRSAWMCRCLVRRCWRRGGFCLRHV